MRRCQNDKISRSLGLVWLVQWFANFVVFCPAFYLLERREQKLSGQINEKLWERQEVSYMLIVLPSSRNIGLMNSLPLPVFCLTKQTKETEFENSKYCIAVWCQLLLFIAVNLNDWARIQLILTVLIIFISWSNCSL